MGRVRRFTGLQRVVEGEGANSQGENGSVLKPFPSEIRVWVRCVKHYNITRIQLHANRTIQGGTELCSLTSATNEILHVNEVAIVDGLTMSTTRVSRERFLLKGDATLLEDAKKTNLKLVSRVRAMRK